VTDCGLATGDLLFAAGGDDSTESVILIADSAPGHARDSSLRRF